MLPLLLRSVALLSASAPAASAPAASAPAVSASDVRPPAISGVVFVDGNGNGRRDAGEAGLKDVIVSDQRSVVRTDAQGRYQLPDDAGAATGVVFVSLPDGYAAVGAFYRNVSATTSAPVDFALRVAPAPRSFTFVHASDTHLAPASLPRTQRLRAMVDSIKPDFVLITGDLVRDALRVSEQEASGYYDLFDREAALFTQPLWTVPGNHENFGIERDKSKVSASHPLYGRTMYRAHRGPDYYSFTRGGVHFVALNSVDIDDMYYYGHVDSLQLAWLARDLAAIPSTMPVVTFNHIPFFSAMESVNGYNDGPPAPSIITVAGKSDFRHTVSNARAVLALLKGRPYPLALAGHVHTREALRLTGIDTRFDQAAAVVGPSGGTGLSFPSGITVYRVTAARIGEGLFVPLGPVP